MWTAWSRPGGGVLRQTEGCVAETLSLRLRQWPPVSDATRWRWWLGRRVKLPRPQSARSASAYCASTSDLKLVTRSGSMCGFHCWRCFRTWFILSHALFVQSPHPASTLCLSIGSILHVKYERRSSGTVGRMFCWSWPRTASYDTMSVHDVRPSFPKTPSRRQSIDFSLDPQSYTNSEITHYFSLCVPV